MFFIFSFLFRYKTTSYGCCWLSADAHASGLERFRAEDDEDFLREKEELTKEHFDPYYEFDLGKG